MIHYAAYSDSGLKMIRLQKGKGGIEKKKKINNK
jgi:hypothetical protein